MADSVVLAYSGGLDTSVLVGWLMDKGYDVHCLYVDLGQPCEDIEAILQKDLDIGAKSSISIDVQEELCRPDTKTSTCSELRLLAR